MNDLLPMVIFNRLKNVPGYEQSYSNLLWFCKRQGFTVAQVRKIISSEPVMHSRSEDYQLRSRVNENGVVCVYLEEAK
ncbi:hypothetical protein SAMN03092900_0419 [Thiomicrospira sp. ALE5]|nr:hypothetical protein SAMN03092900_0419 [Thiomicrospira sp. ALE5]